MTLVSCLAYAVVLDTDLRAYLAKSAKCGGPYATGAYYWLRSWHAARGIPFTVPQRVCSAWMREQGLLKKKHDTMYTVIENSANKGKQRRAEADARERRRQYRAERGQRV